MVHHPRPAKKTLFFLPHQFVVPFALRFNRPFSGILKQKGSTRPERPSHEVCTAAEGFLEGTGSEWPLICQRTSRDPRRKEAAARGMRSLTSINPSGFPRGPLKPGARDGVRNGMTVKPWFPFTGTKAWASAPARWWERRIQKPLDD